MCKYWRFVNTKQQLNQLTKTITMKTLTLSITSVLLSVLLMLTSCTKQNEIVSPVSDTDVLTEQFKKEAEQMSQEFITDQQCNRVWWVLAAKDALGGAWTYYQGGDLVDCVLGAAVTSVLCAMDVNGGNGFDWYKNINRGQYKESTLPNPNNSFDFMGYDHNQLVINGTIASVDNQLSVYDGAVLATNVNPSRVISEKELIAMVSGIVNAKSNEAILKEIGKSNLSPANKWILNFYFDNCFRTKSVAALQHFSVKMENMIVANKKLSNHTKQGLLMTMAINRYSTAMWNDIM